MSKTASHSLSGEELGQLDGIPLVFKSILLGHKMELDGHGRILIETPTSQRYAVPLEVLKILTGALNSWTQSLPSTPPDS